MKYAFFLLQFIDILVQESSERSEARQDLRQAIRWGSGRTFRRRLVYSHKSKESRMSLYRSTLVPMFHVYFFT